MKLSYDEMYIADVQKNLGFLFQFSLCNLKKKSNEFQSDFLLSEIPYQIEIGNPDFLCGKSGYELAQIVYKGINLDEKIAQVSREFFYPQAEYWSGFVLGYVQWKLQVTFNDILKKYSLERILSNYHIMHEADVSKMVELIADVVLC